MVTLTPLDSQTSESDDEMRNYEVNAPVDLSSQRTPRVPPLAAGEDAMLSTIVNHENPNLDVYKSILSDINTNGASPVTEGIRAKAADDDNARQINLHMSAVANGELTLDEAELNLANTPAKTPDDVRDLHQQALIANLQRNQAKTPTEKIIAAEKWHELVEKGYPVEEAIRDRLDWLQSQLLPGSNNVGFGDGGLTGLGEAIVRGVPGVLADLLPFATTTTFVRAFNKVFPDNTVKISELPRGQLAVAFRKRMADLTPEDQFQVASDFMDAVMGDDGIITGSAWQTLMILHEALNEDFGTFDQVIGNVISVLDTVFLGQLAKGAFNIARGIYKPGTPLSTVNIANPQAAERLAASGVKNDLSNGLGMTPAEIVEVHVVPKTFQGNIELLPPSLVKQLQLGDEITADVITRTEGNTLVTSVAEQTEAARNFRHEIKEVGNSGLYESNVTVASTDTGIKFTGIYGKTNTKGVVSPYNSPRDAAEAAAQTFPDAKSITIYQRKPKGNLVPIKPGKNKFKGSKRTGEFVYEVEGFKTYAMSETLANKIWFGAHDVVTSGPLAKWFTDPASRFAKWISGAFSQSGDQARGLAHQLNQIALPFSKLKGSKQREVVLMLQRYAKDPKSMDINKLAQLAKHDEDLVSGFLSYRQTLDALYELENRNLRNDLILQGAKHLSVKGFQRVGTKLSAGNARNSLDRVGDKIEVYDPVKGAMIKLDAAQVNKLYDRGNALWRVREPVGEAAQRSDLVMITGGGNKIRELPVYVLNKIDGYIPRYYKDTYFVQKLTKGTLNGGAKTNQQILRAVGSKSDANQVVKQLLAEGKLTAEQAEKAIIHDRTMAPSARATLEMDDRISLGRMFYHTRADQRLRGIDGLAEVSDPVEAMIKNIDSTSKYVSEFELLTTMKQRWLNTFGKKYNLVEKNKVFPQNRDEIGSSFVGTGVEKRQALEVWDKIKHTETIATKEGELWRDTLMDLVDGLIGKTTAETLWGRALKVGTAPLRGLANNSPNKIMRSIAFTHLIALNPFRQIYVQSQQFMFLSALSPKTAPKLFAQGQAVNFGVMTRLAQPKVYAKMKGGAAKAMGMSSKEYDDFIDGYMRTGLPHSVDSHDYVANTLAEYTRNISGNMFQRGVRRAWNVANAPTRMLKKVGFNYGELSNLSSTFLLARQRFLKATGKTVLKSRKDWETVAADARNLALDMTRSGAFRYQEGAFSALTQFLSIQHKAALAILPFKGFGNQAFTRNERIRLLLGQVVLNGAAGLGIVKLYQQVKAKLGAELDPLIDQVIVGGMYETVINQAIQLATDDDTKLNIAGSIAPQSGINHKFGDVLDAMIGHKPLTDAMAFTNVFNRYSDAAQTINAMRQYPELTNDKQITKMISAFASVTSGWNQVVRARAAMRLGVHVSNRGSPTVQATFASALAEGLLGLQTHSLRDMYGLQEEYANTIQNKDVPWDPDRELVQAADAIYNDMVRIVTLYQDEFDPDIEGLQASPIEKLHRQRMNEALSMHSQIFAIYDLVEQDRIWQRFSERATLDRVQGKKGLIEGVLKKVLSGDLHGHKVEYAVNRIRQLNLYDPNSAEGRQIEFTINQLINSMNGLETLSETLEERQ